MNPIAEFVKKNRKAAGLTQEEFALRSGLGLRFVRELEQGKETVRMDKVNIALGMFNAQAVPGKKKFNFNLLTFLENRDTLRFIRKFGISYFAFCQRFRGLVLCVLSVYLPF